MLNGSGVVARRPVICIQDHFNGSWQIAISKCLEHLPRIRSIRTLDDVLAHVQRRISASDSANMHSTR